MADNLKKSSRKVQDALDQFGLNMDVLELPESTRTAKEAAKAIGCQVGQIAKSLIFKTVRTERPVQVIASGVNRVNVEKLSNHIGEQIT
jgi:prolyl-tRNA editing enzyme YbaK/EbsC (Cys-tRNA(Pro) deacylase)